jgi:hypothetical protein
LAVKKKPYIERLQEEVALCRVALKKLEEYHTAETYLRNTAYPHDAEVKANKAYEEFQQALKAAQNYTGEE